MEQINIIENPKGTFSCDIDISKDEWLSLLKDSAMPQSFKESLLKFYYYPNHRGSCTAVCNEMGGNPKSLNLTITDTLNN